MNDIAESYQDLGQDFELVNNAVKRILIGEHIERECLAFFTFAKLGCFVKQFLYHFSTTQILGAVAADLLY